MDRYLERAAARGRGADAPQSGEPEVPFVALERLHGELEDELQAGLGRVLRTSGFVLSEEVERFEAEFAEYCGVRHCVGVSSGTAALSLALRAHGIGPGQEVIVPAHTFIASALAVAHVGARPILCDVSDDSGLIDPAAARALVGPRTAALIGVHLYGQACDIDALNEFAGPAGLLVLEDAAQAHGARLRGRRVGSLGGAAGFSFYPTKNLGALGDGGAICTNDSALAERLRRLRNLGQADKGRHVEIGYNERLDGFQAAVLRIKLPHLDAWNAKRRAQAIRYRELLPPGVRVLKESAESPCVYHLFPVRVPGRDRMAGGLRRRGIATGVHYAPAVHRHAAWADYPLRHGVVSRAERWAAEQLSLPMHAHLTDREVERVAHAVRAEMAAAQWSEWNPEEPQPLDAPGKESPGVLILDDRSRI